MIDDSTAINIKNYETSNLGSAKDKGIIAHEYMHAIFYKYGITGNGDIGEWMHESFARFSGMAFELDYTESCTARIRDFLTTPEKSLYDHSSSYTNRHYGSCLFPLYIYQEMGGYSAIKKILESYSSTQNHLSAINAGLALQNSSYSLAEAYAGCAAFNSNADYFYDIAPTGNNAWEKPQAQNITHSLSLKRSAMY